MANSDVALDYTNKGLTSLPSEDPQWSRASILLLEGNKIETLNTSLLPRTLIYLDMSDNPLKEITGTLPNLTNLILSGTEIKKIPRLPETLTEIQVSGTPFHRKYRIDDIEDIKKHSDWPLDIYDIVIDRTPEPSYNSNSNSNVPTNSTSNQQLMVLERIDTENDIQYKVQTLKGTTKLISKHLLQPYEPVLTNMVTPIPAGSEIPNVYILEGHGEDILFEKPVPPGCVYVTIEECGIMSADWFKLLYAFEDKPPGIREKLRDPVKHRVELMTHFGRSFHVHYPEAELEGDRTYVEHINSPFSGWNKRGKCFIGKSGIFSLDHGIQFLNPSVDDTVSDIEKFTKTVNCASIMPEDYDYIFSGSLYPTRKMVDTLAYEDIVPYSQLDRKMDHFQYSQSWAFKMFPGIHYNFSCRAIEKHEKTNERIGRRRALSLEGPTRNIASIPEEQIRGPQGIQLLNEAIKVKNIELVKTLIARGVDINEQALETAIDKINSEALELFLKVPGVDTTKASKAIDKKIESVEAIKDYSNRDREIILSAIEDMKTSVLAHVKKGGRKTRGKRTRYKKTRKLRQKYVNSKR